MLLICTSSADAVSRVRAGEALSAAWLKATRNNMSLVPLSQALEVDETRRALQHDVLDDVAFAQIIARVGWLPLGRRGLPPTPAGTSMTWSSGLEPGRSASTTLETFRLREDYRSPRRGPPPLKRPFR